MDFDVMLWILRVDISFTSYYFTNYSFLDLIIIPVELGSFKKKKKKKETKIKMIKNTSGTFWK